MTPEWGNLTAWLIVLGIAPFYLAVGTHIGIRTGVVGRGVGPGWKFVHSFRLSIATLLWPVLVVAGVVRGAYSIFIEGVFR